MQDIKILKEMAAKLAYELKYQKFNKDNVNHQVIRDSILEEYGLLEKEELNEATISNYGEGHKLVVTRNLSDKRLKFLKAKEGDVFTIVAYDASAPIDGTSGKRTTLQNEKGEKFTIQSDSDITGLNHYKGNSTSGKKMPTSEDIEKGICVAYNMKMNPNISKEDAIEMAEMDVKEFEAFDESLLTIGQKIVNNANLSMGSTMTLEGGKKPSHSSKWNSGRSPSKTDMGTPSYNISLKIGDANMIANPNGPEAQSTLLAGLEYHTLYENQDLSSQVNELVTGIENEWIKVSKKVRVKEVKALGKDEYVKIRTADLKQKYNKQYTMNHMKLQAEYEYDITIGPDRSAKKAKTELDKLGLIETNIDDVVSKFISNVRKMGMNGKEELKEELADALQQSMTNKKWDKKLGTFFDKNPNYKKWLVFEAMTGQTKFNGTYSQDVSNIKNPAVANYLLKASKTGGILKSATITHKFAESYAKSVTSRVSFKHNAGAMFLEVKKTLNSGFIIEEAEDNFFNKIFEEEYAGMETRLNEAYMGHMELLNEGIFSDLKKSATKDFKSLTDTVKKIYEEFIKGFLLKMVNKLILIGKNGYNALMETLGFEFEAEEVKIII